MSEITKCAGSKEKQNSVCCVIAGEKQNLQKWEKWGGQGEIIEDLVSHCNNLAFYCAYSKRYIFFLLIVNDLMLFMC